jgi:hypothetical protein
MAADFGARLSEFPITLRASIVLSAQYVISYPTAKNHRSASTDIAPFATSGRSAATSPSSATI